MRRRICEARNEESGWTLVEVLVAVAIVGIAFAAILGGFSTSVMASDIHRKQAGAEDLLVSAAEEIKVKDYVLCTAAPSASLGPYTLTAPAALPAGFTAPPKIEKVELWTGTAWTPWWTSGAASYVSGACVVDPALQNVTLSVSSADGRASERVSVVKRNALS